MCLSDKRQPVVLRLFRLHAVVMLCFVVGVLFNTVSAQTQQTMVESSSIEPSVRSLQFDDIPTPQGWGELLQLYNGLIFEGFYPFKPSHPRFKGLISEYDLNCAVSEPNALHGSRYNFDLSISSSEEDLEPESLPSFRRSEGNGTFTLHAIKIKPLNFPVNHVAVNLRGHRTPPPDSIALAEAPLSWSVDFPAGFHDVLVVNMEDFTHHKWDNLSRVEVWADFHNAGTTMDWEFCIDDVDIQYSN